MSRASPLHALVRPLSLLARRLPSSLVTCGAAASFAFPHASFSSSSSSSGSPQPDTSGSADVMDPAALAEFREAVRDFASRVVAPHAVAIDENNSFPSDVNLWKEMGDMGLHGVTVPDDYGGLDMGYEAHVVAMEELSRASASVALSYGAHSNLCINQIVRNGNPDQKALLVPPLVSGDHVGALAMSEPNAGSDVVSMKCRADATNVRGEAGYVINGNKMWITNGPTAQTLVVYAKTDVENNRITAFLIDKDMEGFRTAQKLDKLGMRGSDTCELVFEDCFVPADRVLGEVHGGVYVLMSGLDLERLVLSGGPIGIMQACLDVTLPYVRERKQFGKPIGEMQLVQAKLADMFMKTNSARAYSASIAKQFDTMKQAGGDLVAMGRKLRKDCAASILFSSEHATQCALDAVQLLGGNGYVNEYPTGRLLRDAKLYEIGAGTQEIRRILIGRELVRD
ncbi:isovaleryl-CoA dehydrogenase [Pycnococcus provasolii]